MTTTELRKTGRQKLKEREDGINRKRRIRGKEGSGIKGSKLGSSKRKEERKDVGEQ